MSKAQDGAPQIDEKFVAVDGRMRNSYDEFDLGPVGRSRVRASVLEESPHSIGHSVG